MFNAPFERSTLFYRPFIIMNIIYLLLVITPIIIVDIVTFYFIEWGYQLLIVGIESFVFSILVIVLSLIEFLKIRRKFFKDEDDSYLAINPKMFDNAYTVAGGIPNNDIGQRATTLQKVRKIEGFEDSQSLNLHQSYSYNAQMRIDDATNLSSIGFLSRFNSEQGLVDKETREKRLDLHNILNKLHKKNPMYEASSVNIMNFKDNQIFKKRKGYEADSRMNDEDDFDKYDQEYLRRCQSYEDFREVDETFAPNKRELIEEKCISYPPSPRDMEKIEHYLFSDQIDEIRDKLKAEFAYNNLYADASFDNFDPESELGRIRARRVQTYGKDFHKFEVKGEEEKEDVEVDPEYAQGILHDIIGNLSDEDAERDDQLVRRTKRERMALAKKRKMEIPDFAIEDIMGEFDIDDQGNYVILRNDENGNLEDRNGKKVNRRGYLVDKYNNVIDKYGNLIFKEKELDSDDEIPPPYSFEKRKMQLLNNQPDKVEKYHMDNLPPEDDDHIWMDRKGRDLADTMSGDETPVESMMGETPGKYLKEKKEKKASKHRPKTRTIHEDNINIDLDSQKETVKLDSTMHPGSIRSSNKTKRLISARVKGFPKEKGVDTMIDGFVKDLPFYFNGMPNIHDSIRNTPKMNKRRLKKKGKHDSSLRKIYGNIDPFLYKNDSAASGVRLDKVTNLKDKKQDNFRLAESTEIEGRLNAANTDEELESDLYRNSRLDRVPSRYKERSTLGETSIKTKLNDLEDIYYNKKKKHDNEFSVGRKTHYDSRLSKIGQKNSNTITRNMFTAETSSLGSGNIKAKKNKKPNDSRPSVDYVLKHRGLEEGGWV